MNISKVLSGCGHHSGWALLFAFLIAGFWTVGVQGQTGDAAAQLPKVIPPSPNAAALGKYGDIPVNPHTGVPNISIPLHEVREGGLSLPISLSYHASGVRVSEAASWVGLNWALNAGGVITRSVQHVADEGPIGYRHPPFYLSGYGGPFQTGYYRDGYILPPAYPLDAQQSSAPSEQKRELLIYQDAATGNVDCEPDLFFFNVGGYSGKFLFQVERQNGQLVRKAVFIPREDIDVQVDFRPVAVPTHTLGTTQTRETFASFTLTVPDGTRYHFGGENAVEYSGTESYNDASYRFADFVKPLPTAWYLTKIESADGKRSITLEYGNDYYSFFDLAPERISNGDQMLSLNNQAIMRTAIIGKKLKSIRSSDTEIEFEALTVREDLADYTNTGGTEGPNGTTSKRLDRIRIKRITGECIKSYEFGYGYFECLDNGKMPYFIDNWSPTRSQYQTDRKRLRLETLTEKSCGDMTKPPHVFAYDTTRLPRRISYQQDHWGYYNGATGNQSLIAFTTAPRNADREANPEFSKAGMLTSIQYPTGGSTAFAYEPHEVTEFEPVMGDLNNYSAAVSLMGEEMEATQTIVVLEDPIEGPICSNAGSICPNISQVTVSLRCGDPRFPGAADCSANLTAAEETTPYVQVTKPDGTVVWSWGLQDWKCHFNPSFCTGGSPCATAGNCTYEVSSQTLTVRKRLQHLPPGTYTLKAFRYRSPTRHFQGGITVTLGNKYDGRHVQQYRPVVKKAGGLRMLKTTDRVVANGGTIEKKYTYPETGKLFSKPVYFHEIKVNPMYYTTFQLIISGCGSFPIGTVGQVWSSSSIIPMQTTQGAHVGYRQVKTEQPGNGHSLYEYDMGEHYYQWANDPYFAGDSRISTSTARYYLYPPYPVAHNYERGNLVSEKSFSSSDRIVSEKQYYYEIGNAARESNLNATKIEYFKPCVQADYVSYTHYPVFTGKSRLLRQVNRSYDQNGVSKVESVIENTYGSSRHLQATAVKQANSEGQEITQRFVYPPDYGGLQAAVAGIKNLQDKHVINVPVEKYTTIQATGSTAAQVTAGTLAIYNETMPYLQEIKLLEMAGPLALEQFTPSNATPGSFTADPHYRSRLVYKGYDAKGNMREVTKTEDAPTVYLWGYSHQYPVAEIKNATYEQVRDALGGQAAVDQLASSATLTSAQISQVNGLRQALPRAMVTAYTYEPLVGMSSQTGPDGITVFYEYDGFQRLKVVKDRQGNVLKRYQYHYTGRPLPVD